MQIATNLALRTDRQSVTNQGETLESTNQFSVEIIQVGTEGCYFRFGQATGVSVSGKFDINDLSQIMDAFCLANPRMGEAIAFSMLGKIGQISLEATSNKGADE